MPNRSAGADRTNPRNVFVAAEQFYRCANLILKQLNAATTTVIPGNGHTAYRMAPVVAISAFAFELFLKCLLSIDGVAPPKTHNLRDIFAKLPKRTQSEIEARYDEQRAGSQFARGPDFAMRDVLEGSADAFESHRYIFELHDPTTVSQYTVHVLCNTVRAMLVEAHPDWDW